MKQVAIVKATGAVGQEILSLLEKRNFPLSSLRLFASEKPKGKKFFFSKRKSLHRNTRSRKTQFL